MHVFHFGTSRRQLFGAYHPAESPRRHAAGLVICQPFGHEYIRAHRAVRTLAARVARSGVHVLRFDYYGTGDSYGEGTDVSVTQCREDVGTAIDELKDTADLQRVSLLGVRFGALVAAGAASERRDVEALFLWDPVVRGRDYLADVRTLHARWVATRAWMRHAEGANGDHEIIGFPVPVAFAADLDAIDIVRTARWPKHVGIAASRSVDVAPLVEALSTAGVSHVAGRVDSDCEWQRPAAVHLTLLAAEVTAELARQIAGPQP